MATAVTSSIPHQLPPIGLQQVSRIRPPRIPKGTPSPNSIPQPSGPVPPGKIWVQGQWRDPSSNAAKDRRRIQGRQIEKAVQRQVHGMNIYAYTHVRTNQVVYSLTRSLQNAKVLKQLLFHGKKTVPRAVRRDMWRPYFSLHFPQTPVGAQTGLGVYQQLRELAIQRQLSPPKELLMTTEDDLYQAKHKKGDPISMSDKINDHKIKLPNLNQMLPKKMRARKLMNQQGSSVADVAFLLGLVNEGTDPEERFRELEKNRSENFKKGTQRARRRLRLIREKEAAKEEQLSKTAALVKKVNGNEGQILMDSHTAHRLSWGYQGIMSSSHEIQDLEELNEAKQSIEEWRAKANTGGQVAALTSHDEEKVLREAALEVQRNWEAQHHDSDSMPEVPQELVKQKQDEALQKFQTDIKARSTPEPGDESSQASRKVTVLWSDLRDGTYAESWSDNVFHGELEPRAVSKRSKMVVTQFKTVDNEEQLTSSEVWQPRTVVAGSSIHVIGSELGQWVDNRAEFLARRDAQRTDREEDVNNLEAYQAALKIRQLRRAGEMQNKQLQNEQQEYLLHLEEKYPAAKVEEDRHDEWMTSSTQRLELAKNILRLHKIYPELSTNQRQDQKILRHDGGGEWDHRLARDDIFEISTRLVRFADLMNKKYDMTSVLYNLEEVANPDDVRTVQHDSVGRKADDSSSGKSDEANASHSDAANQELLDYEHEFSILENLFPQFSEMEQRLDSFVGSENVEAMYKIVKEAERQYRTSSEAGKEFETAHSIKGSSQATQSSSSDPDSDMRAKRRADADIQALRNAGIETDAPRMGIWARVKGLFGR